MIGVELNTNSYDMILMDIENDVGMLQGERVPEHILSKKNDDSSINHIRLVTANPTASNAAE